MNINEKILQEIKEKMRKEIIEKKSITDLEKYLLEYLRKLDPIEIAIECDGSVDEAIDAIQLLQSSDELRKIGFMSD